MRFKSTFRSICLLLITLLTLHAGLTAQDFSYSETWGKSGLSIENQTRSGVQLNFSIDKFSIQTARINDADMHNVVLDGVMLPNEEGHPNLPAVSRYLAVPNGARPVLNIVDYRIEKYEGYEIAPSPVIPLDTDKSPLKFEKSEVYARDAFYPADPFTLSEVTRIRGVEAVMLGLTPFQYNPVTKELLVYRDVKVEISFENGSGEFGENRLRSRWWDPILQDVFLNSASLPKIDYNKQRNQVLSFNRDAGYEYLIVVPNAPEFMQWADSIKEFRQKQGILTGIVTLAEIGGNTPAILEAYFNNAYSTWEIPPAAVLLLADYGSSATNTITSPIYDNYCVSDNIFADYNGNHMPDMIFARITANNASQLQTMVTKFIHYEKNPPTNPDFYNHPITALGWQTERWFQICSETVGGFWRNQGKNPVRINEIYSGTPGNVWSTTTYGNTNAVVNYFGPNGLEYIPQTPAELGGWSGGTSTMVNNAINSGAFMLQHRDHGFEQGWGEPDYTSSHINSLNNTDLTFVFSINCLTGMYDMGGECFTEKFHRHTANGHNSGALGLIAASEVSYSFVNDAFVWGMFDNMYPEFMPDYGMPVDERGLLPAFGNAAGKYFLQQSQWPYNTNNKEVTYNLFHHHGGAFLNVYSEVPQQMAVTHNPVLISGESVFSVTAEAGSFIALTVDGEIIGTAEGTGSPVSIEIEPQLPPNEMLVTITAQNFYRYEQIVEIIPPDGPYVVYDNSSINDTEGGNGNGLMDQGEIIFLEMNLKNVGVEPAQNIQATLTSDSDFITIINGSANFGNIDPGATQSLEDAFEFEVAGNIPDNQNISFSILATDGSQNWESFFTIKSYAPNLTIPGVTVSDVNGNNNGVLDPGEDADIILEVSNTGSGNATGVVASLISQSPFITLNNSSVELNDLNAGETKTATFNVSVAQATPIGTIIDMIFSVESGMYSLSYPLGLKVGLTIEDFESGDFGQYEWEFGGNANWTIASTGAYEGTYAAKSGNINDNQDSEMIISMDVINDDEISFYHKVSSEANYDYLRFYIDGVQMGQWAGTTQWQMATYPVTAGERTFKWSYEKDQSVSNGSDCGWVDYITFPAAASEALMIFAGPDEEVCEGTYYQLNAMGANYESLVWETSGTGSFSDNTILDPVYTPSNDDYTSGYVTLTITAIGNSNSMSDEMVLSFMPMPEQCPTPQGETALCENPGTVVYHIEEAVNSFGFMWVLSPEEAGTMEVNEMEAHISWDENFTGTAQLMVAGYNMCGQGEMSEPLEINVMSFPMEASAPEGETELCQGSPTVQYSVQEIMYADDYLWQIEPENAGTIEADGTIANVLWNVEWYGEAMITVWGANSCGEGVESSPLEVSITALPTIPLAPAGETMICEGSENVIYTTEGAAIADDYEWEILPAEAAIISANGTEANFSFAEGFHGEVNIHVMAINNCGTSEFSETITVDVDPKPAQPEAISGESQACQGVTKTFTVPDIAYATSAEWIIEPDSAGTIIQNGTNCDITLSNTWTGQAQINVRGVNDCGNSQWSESFLLTVEDCTGIEEYQTANLKVHPNPNHGEFSITLETDDVLEIRIVNATGETIYSETNIAVNGTLQRNIQISEVANGVYYLMISGRKTNAVQKIIVNK
jgi:hypothetical protein